MLGVLDLNRLRGTGSHRLSVGTGWSLPFNDAIGDSFLLSTTMRGDGYYATDLRLAPNDPARDTQTGRIFPQMMTPAGTLVPSRVFVMGVGVAGLQAIATARRLGAIVTATDVRPATKEQVQSLGAKFVAVENEEFKAEALKILGDDFYCRTTGTVSLQSVPSHTQVSASQL